MWLTNSGPRTLFAVEAKLFQRIIQRMVEGISLLEDDSSDSNQRAEYGIDWYDQWDPEQQLWLLERVSIAFFTKQPPPQAAAMWDATVDAMIHRLIQEIDQELQSDVISNDESWRAATMNAIAATSHNVDALDWSQLELTDWMKLSARIAEELLGPTSYRSAEAFRDREAGQLAKYLMQKGLPEDYLTQIPPVRTRAQANDSRKRIRLLIEPH